MIKPRKYSRLLATDWAVPALTKSGETLSIQFTAAPVGDAEGELAEIVAVLRDVTRMFQQLKRLRARE